LKDLEPDDQRLNRLVVDFSLEEAILVELQIQPVEIVAESLLLAESALVS